MAKKSKKMTAIVTGGSKRIGRAICLRLAEMGYDIALHYNTSADDARTLQKQIRSMDVQCQTFKCDLTKSRQSINLLKKVGERFCGIDLLVNNASIFQKDQLSSTTEVQFDQHFNVHVKSPYFISQEYQRLFKAGHIINILDTKIVQSKTEHFSYLLSKKALSEFTKMSAIELAPTIRVNAIAPGLILPPEDQTNAYLDRRAKDIPLRRRGDVRNIIQTLEFLLSNDFLTGQTIFVDGGEHLLG